MLSWWREIIITAVQQTMAELVEGDLASGEEVAGVEWSHPLAEQRES